VPTLEVKAIEAKYGHQPYKDEMMTRLVQGIGRLVRRVGDNGRIYIADSRAKNIRWATNSMSKHVPEFSPFKRRYQDED
jgi:Rad3-related DNA helicase